jgi:hypothetical protein
VAGRVTVSEHALLSWLIGSGDLSQLLVTSHGVGTLPSALSILCHSSLAGKVLNLPFHSFRVFQTLKLLPLETPIKDLLEMCFSAWKEMYRKIDEFLFQPQTTQKPWT